MKIEAGCSVLVTGGGSGIGRALALALASCGASVTIVDFVEANGLKTLELLGSRGIFVKCDVTKPAEVRSAFEKHIGMFGRLDVCVNSAGIGGHGDFLEDQEGEWRRVIDVNFNAVVECTRCAVQAMRKQGQPGVILNLASASGLYPAPLMPIYSGSKGGVVLFTRSLTRLRKENIRVNVLCPEFIETPMTQQLAKQVINTGGGYISMDKIIEGAFQLIEDESKAGACLWITNRRGLEYWPTPEEEKKYLVRGSRRPITAPDLTKKAEADANLPNEYRKVVVHRLDSNFRLATKIVKAPLRIPVKPGHILIKYYYAGVNASDVNFSSGRYFGSAANALEKLPFDAGFEAVGVVAGIGEGTTGFKLGSPVATLSYGGFTEYSEVSANHVISVPAPSPEVVGILVSGLTASIALEEAGMKSGESVLVTAAAGGTGQFAVQLAKLAGSKVIATCGGRDKAQLLSSLGVDRVIDYRSEDVKKVLKREFPNGVELVYESVGGEMFDTCLGALATFGRLIVIGMISQYLGHEGANAWHVRNYPGLCEKLLYKSQTLIGFFFMNHSKKWKAHVNKLHDLYVSGKLKVAIDPTPFVGLDSVPDAVEYLHSGRSRGKVVVTVDANAGHRNNQSRL